MNSKKLNTIQDNQSKPSLKSITFKTSRKDNIQQNMNSIASSKFNINSETLANTITQPATIVTINSNSNTNKNSERAQRQNNMKESSIKNIINLNSVMKKRKLSISKIQSSSTSHISKTKVAAFLNNLEETEIPKYLFFKEEDLEKLPQEFITEIEKLKSYYEKKTNSLLSEINDLKTKIKMDKTLREFVVNFDKVNQKLCNEIDDIKTQHNFELNMEREKFNNQLNELKVDIFDKIVNYRDQTRELIVNGTSSREVQNKAQIKCLSDQLCYSSDAYEALFNKNIEMKFTVKKKDILITELENINKKYKQENGKLTLILKNIKDILISKEDTYNEFLSHFNYHGSNNYKDIIDNDTNIYCENCDKTQTKINNVVNYLEKGILDNNTLNNHLQRLNRDSTHTSFANNDNKSKYQSKFYRSTHKFNTMKSKGFTLSRKQTNSYDFNNINIDKQTKQPLLMNYLNKSNNSKKLTITSLSFSLHNNKDTINTNMHIISNTSNNKKLNFNHEKVNSLISNTSIGTQRTFYTKNGNHSNNKNYSQSSNKYDSQAIELPMKLNDNVFYNLFSSKFNNEELSKNNNKLKLSLLKETKSNNNNQHDIDAHEDYINYNNYTNYHNGKPKTSLFSIKLANKINSNNGLNAKKTCNANSSFKNLLFTEDTFNNKTIFTEKHNNDSANNTLSNFGYSKGISNLRVNSSFYSLNKITKKRINNMSLQMDKGLKNINLFLNSNKQLNTMNVDK